MIDDLALKRSLTDRQWLVLLAVLRVGRDGWPVSVREAAAASESGVQATHSALRALEVRELVERNPRWPSGRGGWRATDRGYWVSQA